MLLVVSLILNFVFLNCDKEKKGMLHSSSMPEPNYVGVGFQSNRTQLSATKSDCLSDLLNPINRETFNESILIAKHHIHLKQIQTFLKTVHQNVHEERTAQDLEHETTGHDKEHYTITELLKTTQDSSTFVSTLRESRDVVYARAYVPTFPRKSSTNGALEQSSKFSYPVETTVNWYKYFSLPSPTVKTRHPLGHYSKHRRHRTTKNLHEKFVFLSNSTTKQTRKPDTKKSQEHIDISSPSSVVAKTARIHKSPMNYEKSVPNRHKAIIIFQKQSGVSNSSSFLSNTQRDFKLSIMSQKPAMTITHDSTINTYKQFGLPSPNSNNPFHISSIVDKSESTSRKPVLTSQVVATMNSHKNTGLPSFIPSYTPGNRKPSKSQKSGEANLHENPFTNKSTTVNLYELFGLPSPSPTRPTICPGSRHIRKYSSKYPKKKKPDFPEPTGYELSSEDLVPRKKVQVFPPILFSSEVIPQNYFPPYKQIELSTPKTVNSYSEESLRNFPTFENILTSQEPKKSPSTYRIDRTPSSGTRKTATSKRKSPTSTNRPTFLRTVDRTVSPGLRKTTTSKRKLPASTYRPIFLRGGDRTLSSGLRERTTSKGKSLASTKNTNDKKIRVHRAYDKSWHSLTVKDMTPIQDVDGRRQIIHKPKTRKIRSRLLNRKLRTSSPSPRVTHQGISSSVPKGLRLEDHDSMVSEGRPVLGTYEKKIADTGVLYKGASPYQHFEDMMVQLHEGYLPVFLMELVRLVAAKQPSDVYNVVGHVNSVLTELFKKSDLRWFGQPLRDVMISIGRYLAQTDIEGVRNYARTLHNLLHPRRSSLPAHVNSIIDAASLLYEPVEGYALFDSLKEFEKYPDIPRTGRQVCQSLIKSFLRPFRRLHHSKRCRELLVSINDELATRFRSYRLRSSEDSDEENQSRSLKYVFKRTRYNKRRQRRRHKPYRNESPNRRQVETFKLRRMKPSTEQQKQLSIILPKHRRANTHTNAQFQDKETRKTIDYSHTRAKQFIHDNILGADDGKLLDRRESTGQRGDLKANAKGMISVYLQKNHSEPRDIKGRLKTGMLRIDSSSYSDEEEALKSNLVQALMQENGSALDVRENSAVMGDDAVEKSVKDTENKRIIQSSEESHFLLKDKK